MMLTVLALTLALTGGVAGETEPPGPEAELRLQQTVELAMPACRPPSEKRFDCGGVILGLGPRAERLAVVRLPGTDELVGESDPIQIWDTDGAGRMLREFRLASRVGGDDATTPFGFVYEIVLPAAPDTFFIRAFNGHTYASKVSGEAFAGEAIAFEHFISSDASTRFATSRRGAGWQCWIDVFDAEFGRVATLEATFGSDDECSAHPIDFSADGSRLVLMVESFDDQVLPVIQVWDIASKSMLQSLDAEVAGLSDDGRRVAAWTASDSAGETSGGVVDLATGEQLTAMVGDVPATALTWSPDNRYIASGGEEGPVQLWDATTGREARRFDDPDGEPCAIRPWIETDALKFSPDSAVLYADCKTGLRAYEVSSGRLLRAFTYGDDGLSDVAVSPDHSTVAVIRRKASKDLVEIWTR